MLSIRTLTAATLSATLIAAPASFVMAQDAQPETEATQAPAADAQTPDFADTQIDAFADTAVEMSKVQDKYAQKLQAVEDEAEQQELLSQANSEMREIIEQRDDITLDDYLAINRAASTDESLSLKIAQRMQELQTKNAG